MANRIEIRLDNYENEVYSPGETIVGRVEYISVGQEILNALYIRFLGRAETGWTETENYEDPFTKEEKTKTIRYNDEELYFDQQYDLIEDPNGVLLQPGLNNFPFSYILPPKLPSSFEGVYGNIRYEIKVKLNQSWGGSPEFVLKFNVHMPFNLNYLPQLVHPVTVSDETTPISYCCQNSGPITFDMSLPAAGFTPGQDVNIGVHVENLSNVNIPHIEFEIVGKVEFCNSAHQYARQHQETYVNTCQSNGVGAHGDHSWTTILNIPKQGVYPNLVFCHLINIKYCLRAKLIIPGPHHNIRHNVNVMIGDIPLMGVDINLPTPPVEAIAPSAPPTENESKGDGLPSYEQAQLFEKM